MFRAIDRVIVMSVLVSALMAPAMADEVHYDVFVTTTGTTTGSPLIIGGFIDDDGTATVPVDQMRVFGGHVTGVGAAPYISEGEGEPGFRAGSQAFLNGGNMTPSGTYTALSGSTALNFDFLPISVGAATRNLLFWDGSGPVAFSPVGADVVLELAKYSGPTQEWSASISGSTAGIAAGNSIQDTTATGAVHTHLFTEISQAGAAPQQGFYLYALELSMSGYTSSDPLYFVYGAYNPTAFTSPFANLGEFEAAHEAALEWVEINVVPVPEPSSLALTGLGIAGLVAARWRWSHRAGCSPENT
jgi:hypothetical protein